MAKQDHPQKVLLLSDIHVGAKSSAFGAYQKNIIELMAQYDHVVMIGDCWELFFIDKKHIGALTDLLDVITDKGKRDWKKQFDGSGTTRSGVENVIHGAKWFTEEFLERFPKKHLYFIGGNHESVRRFHNEFEQLQKEHANFEWSPEAVRIGDALITHGHLPIDGKTFTQYPLRRLRDAEKGQKWTDIVTYFGPRAQKIQEFWGKEIDPRNIEKQLTQWSGTGKFMVSHDRKPEPLDMKWVKHIFFGHTHIKFDNYAIAPGGILFHNTGAIVEATAQKPEDLGVLEATLHSDGTITDVQPVKIFKDRKLFLPPVSPDRSAAR